MTSRHRVYLALGFLGAIHATVLFASFLAPYDAEAQDRELPFAPPTRLHFVDSHGQFHLRPFIFACVPGSVAAPPRIEDRTRTFPLHLFVRESSAKREVE